MNSKSIPLVVSISDSALNHWIIDAIQDIKGKNILKLDLTSLDDAPPDYFIVCEGDSSTQIKAISDNITKKVKNRFVNFGGKGNY